MKSALSAAAVVLVVVGGWAAFRAVGDTDQFPFPEDLSEALLKLSFWVVPCAIALRLWGAKTYGQVAAELGLTSSVLRAVGFALAASLPMLLVLSLSTDIRQVLPAPVLISAVVVGPFAEEVLFRGWLFRQLLRRAGWPVIASALVSAVAFGLAHLHSFNRVSLGMEFNAVMSAAAAGALFAWLVWRWDSLWPAVGMHAFMNLSWQLFGSPPLTASQLSAEGATLATAGRLGTIVLAIALTLVLTRRKPT